MIGQLKVPRSLEADRFTLCVPSHNWRDVWDRFDEILGAALIAFTARPGMPYVKTPVVSLEPMRSVLVEGERFLVDSLGRALL
jgi:hypothetical protein